MADSHVAPTPSVTLKRQHAASSTLRSHSAKMHNDTSEHSLSKPSSTQVKRIRMRRATSEFGFCIKGGKGTAVRISRVRLHSASHAAGLKVGDELLEVCGTSVEQCSSQEIYHLLKSQDHMIALKVRRSII